MATVKLKFRSSSVPEAPGTIYYQVTHHRKVKYLNTGYHAYSHEWNQQQQTLVVPPQGERKAKLVQMQHQLNSDLKQWTLLIATMQHQHNLSVDSLCQAFHNAKTTNTVFKFLHQQVVRKEQMNRQGTARTYSNAYSRFKAFRQAIDLTFGELSPDLIEHYEAWLINQRLKPNSIRCYLRTLHTLLCKAHREGLLPSHKHLFSHVRLSYVNTAKRAISEQSLKAIAYLQLPPNTTISLARDMFMFSFYMRGMPFVDIAYLRKADLKHGQLTYCRKKNNQCLTVACEEAQQIIINRYAPQTHSTSYLFPIIMKEDGTEYKQYQRVQVNINRALKKIGRMIGLQIPLTTYVARHTWASIARDMNLNMGLISEAMGHHSLKTTQIYLNSIDTSKVNEANKKIIDRIYGVGQGNE